MCARDMRDKRSIAEKLSEFKTSEDLDKRLGPLSGDDQRFLEHLRLCEPSNEELGEVPTKKTSEPPWRQL